LCVKRGATRKKQENEEVQKGTLRSGKRARRRAIGRFAEVRGRWDNEKELKAGGEGGPRRGGEALERKGFREVHVAPKKSQRRYTNAPPFVRALTPKEKESSEKIGKGEG